MRITVAIIFAALLSACGGLPRFSGAIQPPMALVIIENPDFCTRLVETKSDFALIRSDFQTVLTQGCTPWDGMGDAPVFWLTVDTPKQTEAQTHYLPQRAVQEFRKGSSRLAKPSTDLRGFVALAKESPDTPISVVGHVDAKRGNSDPVKLARARARAVSKWLQSQGVSAKRIEIGTDADPAPQAVATMVLVVTGGI